VCEGVGGGVLVIVLVGESVIEQVRESVLECVSIRDPVDVPWSEGVNSSVGENVTAVVAVVVPLGDGVGGGVTVLDAVFAETVIEADLVTPNTRV
jgi:hypothetical protein